MLRIFLLILVGFFLAVTALRTVASVIVFVADMNHGGQRAPEILGGMTASLLITLALGWVWKKVYFSNQTSPGPTKPK